MSQIEIRLPKMGESVTEATITNWLKEVGDVIEMDEPLVEVATDKVDNELPSEAEGTLVKRFFEVDEVAQVGDVIAIISTDGSALVEESTTEKTDSKATESTSTANSTVNEVVNAPLEKSASDKFFSPLVKSIAEKEGITMTTLESIKGTGQSGRVTKKDILAFIESGAPAVTETKSVAVSTPATTPKKAAPAPAGGTGFLCNIKTPIAIPGPDDEIIEMDRMRKIISERMLQSVHNSPHVTSYVEADMTNIWNWRKKVKGEFQKREGENITFTPIIMEAVVKAIKDFPMINVAVSGNQIIKRKHINIGMATALPSGNLIVPVIKDADQLNLTGITKAVNGLANKARNNKLTPEDIQGGTYTVTNVGTFGNVMGTPIINQPEVAILALGAIRKVPAVIETPDGDFIGIRYKMFLSHSYDHRVVDGALGGMFVRRVADYLEQFDPNRDF